MNQQELLGFILDQQQREMTYGEGRSISCLQKCRYDEHTDFVYSQQQYNSSSPLRIGEKLDYAGLVSYKVNRFFPEKYQFRELLRDTPNNLDTSEVTKQLVAAVRDEIQRLVGNKPVEITSGSEMLPREDHDREYHLQYHAKSDALLWFYSRNPDTEYIPHLNSGEWTTEQVVDFINNHDTFVTTAAAQFIIRNARSINFTIWEKGETLREYKALESTPGEHHLRRTIADCLSDEKKVTITLLKEGKVFEGKIATNTLKIASNHYYSDYSLDAQDRRVFHEMFGRHAEIFATDITKIAHGRRTLYKHSAD